MMKYDDVFDPTRVEFDAPELAPPGPDCLLPVDMEAYAKGIVIRPLLVRRIKRHVQVCPGCRQTVKILTEIHASTRQETEPLRRKLVLAWSTSSAALLAMSALVLFAFVRPGAAALGTAKDSQYQGATAHNLPGAQRAIPRGRLPAENEIVRTAQDLKDDAQHLNALLQERRKFIQNDPEEESVKRAVDSINVTASKLQDEFK
jgi:hypothetical protein